MPSCYWIMKSQRTRFSPTLLHQRTKYLHYHMDPPQVSHLDYALPCSLHASPLLRQNSPMVSLQPPPVPPFRNKTCTRYINALTGGKTAPNIKWKILPPLTERKKKACYIVKRGQIYYWSYLSRGRPNFL